MLRNLTRFAGYDFGDDPTQLVRIDGQQLRIFGKLFGLEPTVGVSFGLPGGNHGAVGGYAPHLHPHLGVNPYQDGIALGPINVNPLVSFQKGKDKHKTKIFRPLVNLHITPNLKVFKNIKALLKGKGWGWGVPEYSYGWGWPQPGYHAPHPHVEYVPVPQTVEVPVPILPERVKHHHDHFHYPQTQPEVIYASGYPKGGGKGWGGGSSGGYSSSSFSYPPTSYTVGGGSSSVSLGGYPSSISSSAGYPSTGYGNYVGGGSGYGSGYGGYTKFDKMGAATGGNSLVKRPSSGILGGIRQGISTLLDTVSSTVGGEQVNGFQGVGNGGGSGYQGGGGGGGIRNQESGLTPNEESLLNTLLKEEGVGGDDIESITNSRFRSVPFEQDPVGGSGGSGGSNSNRWGSNSVRGGRTHFPNSNPSPGDSHTRLPPNAAYLSDSSSPSSTPIRFEDEGGRGSGSFSTQMTMPTNDESENGGRVTFPEESSGALRRRGRRDTTSMTDFDNVDDNAATPTDYQANSTTPTNYEFPEARSNGAQVKFMSRRKRKKETLFLAGTWLGGWFGWSWWVWLGG